ncbi:hypothetical protein [Streptomyces sp. NPDC087787]|uniref:hypothetical protein n=1 Tax=Streptomyces sp. NPDC087787 TaxID=3365803 RepID=UPI0038085A0D
MSAAPDSARIAPPGNVLTQSVRDSMVVAKRNLIRMTRILFARISQDSSRRASETWT